MRRALGFLAWVTAVSPVAAQEVAIADAAITLSASGRAELWFELESGTEHRLRFEGEAVEVDGIGIGVYASGGGLEEAWREFLRFHAGADAAAVRGGLVDFRRSLDSWTSSDEARGRDAARALAGRIDAILGLAAPTPVAAASNAPAAEPVANVPGRPGPMQIVPGGLGFDVTGDLDRLRDALRRLGDSGEFTEDGLAMIVHGDYEVTGDATVSGDIAILDGTLSLGGEVDGDVLVLDGTLVLGGDARVQGDVLQVGGEVDYGDGTSRVEGEILSDIRLQPAGSTGGSPEAPAARRIASFEAPAQTRNAEPGLGSRLARNFSRATEGVIGATSAFIVLSVLGLLLVYFGRRRVETVSETVRLEFARSFAMGIAGEVLFLPILLVLGVLVITWLVIPFFVLAVGLAQVVGYLAVAHAAGEIFARRRFRSEWLERFRRPNSYYHVVSGVALLILPFAASAALWVFGGAADLVRGLILFVAIAGTWVVVTAGFGGVLLTRAGGRSVVIDWSAADPTGGAGPPEPGADAPSTAVDDA